MFGVSGGLLWLVGYNYDGLTGSAATKIHPATYMIFAVVLWRAASSGNPARWIATAARRMPEAMLLISATAILFADVIWRSAPGMAGTIDSFIPACLLALLLTEMDAIALSRVRITVHLMMLANALMGIAEFLLNHRFFPFRFDGETFPFDNRSSALQGHPLENAAVTACYALCLLVGCRDMSVAMKLPLLMLQLAALVTFGGRTALIVTLSLAFLYAVGRFFRSRPGAGVPVVGAISLLAILGMLPAVGAALAEAGFFDHIMARFSDDGGSTAARIDMFALFHYLTWRDLIAGPDLGLIESLRRIYGLEWGIENPIVKIALYDGVLVAALMTVAVVFFLRALARRAGSGVWLPMTALAILLLSSESVAGKTMFLAKATAIVLCLVPPLWRRSSGAKHVIAAQ